MYYIRYWCISCWATLNIFLDVYLSDQLPCYLLTLHTWIPYTVWIGWISHWKQNNAMGQTGCTSQGGQFGPYFHFRCDPIHIVLSSTVHSTKPRSPCAANNGFPIRSLPHVHLTCIAATQIGDCQPLHNVSANRLSLPMRRFYSCTAKSSVSSVIKNWTSHYER